MGFYQNNTSLTMATVLITGGTGMIGRAITRALLAKNYNVITLSRKTGKKTPAVIVSEPGENNLSYAQWSIKDQIIDKDAVEKADYIIHLAGADVSDKRWTKKRKQEIVDSRVKSGELIAKTLKENTNKVKAVLSSCGTGWYGPDSSIPNPHPFTEDDPAHDDFLGRTCEQWQKCLEPVVDLGKRLVVFRTGMVLSNEGGGLKEFKKPVRFGIASILGTGKQMISWIHIDDLVRLYIAAIENADINGAYNAVSPAPVSNKQFILQLARINRGKLFIPIYVPSFLLKLIFGELSTEVLKSATVSCNKILDAGFAFSYPTIIIALKDLKAKGN